jgi:hypothetical protein
MAVAAITPIDAKVPLRACAAFGALRCQVLDALVLEVPAQIPAPVCDELIAWAREQMAAADGPLRGLDISTVPAAWLDFIGWAGIPLARPGELHWGRDCAQADVDRPTVVAGRLLVPAPEALSELSGVGLKPVRSWVGERLGSRLQAAPGLRVYVWANQALVVSRHDQPVGGFFFGPAIGNRTGLAIDPGSWQLVTW